MCCTHSQNPHINEAMQKASKKRERSEQQSGIWQEVKAIATHLLTSIIDFGSIIIWNREPPPPRRNGGGRCFGDDVLVYSCNGCCTPHVPSSASNVAFILRKTQKQKKCLTRTWKYCLFPRAGSALCACVWWWVFRFYSLFFLVCYCTIVLRCRIFFLASAVLCRCWCVHNWAKGQRSAGEIYCVPGIL